MTASNFGATLGSVMNRILWRDMLDQEELFEIQDELAKLIAETANYSKNKDLLTIAQYAIKKNPNYFTTEYED